jgi:hypothetical protein
MAQADSKPTTETTVAQIADGLSDLEEEFHEVRNLGYAALMLASSDEMQKEPGAALHSVASLIVTKLDALNEERERLWHLARTEVREIAAEIETPRRSSH